MSTGEHEIKEYSFVEEFAMCNTPLKVTNIYGGNRK